MSGNFDDIEITSRKSDGIQNRMSMVSYNMYKQFVEYQQSNANTAIIFDKMAENMSIIVEYFKQSFNRFGIPTQKIFFEYDRQRHIAILNILWHTITFASNMKDFPKGLERVAKDKPALITGRIIAVKGNVPELSNGFTIETMQKLLDMEGASLFVPADKTASAIIKINKMQELPINQQEAPREFLLRVVEMVCGGGNLHDESSRVSLSNLIKL